MKVRTPDTEGFAPLTSAPRSWEGACPLTADSQGSVSEMEKPEVGKCHTEGDQKSHGVLPRCGGLKGGSQKMCGTSDCGLVRQKGL